MDKITEHASRFAHDELITIALENCPETFTVSKALLCRGSKYFTKALDGRFREAKTRTLKLPGCSAETFKIFMYHAADEEIPGFDDEVIGAEKDVESKRLAKEQWFLRLMRVWVFGDSFLLLGLQNDAMHRLLELVLLGNTWMIPSIAVKFAFENSAIDSQLCKMAVKEAAYSYAHGRYSSADMERLSAIPGFFELFAVELKAHYTGSLTAGGWPHAVRTWKEFMVERPSR